MTKAYEMYKQIDISQGVSLLPCPCCGMSAQLWRYAKSGIDPSTLVAMCSNGDKFGPQDGAINEGCLLYMPPDNFYRATIRDAVKYWNEYASALLLMQRSNRWKTANVLRRGTNEGEPHDPA
jgi:hypothetical protein